jgi:hypothetical protein
VLNPYCLFDFFSYFCWTVAALAMANARIASLEAELSASQKAYDVATAAKANAEKSQKLALAKAKKNRKSIGRCEQRALSARASHGGASSHDVCCCWR